MGQIFLIHVIIDFATPNLSLVFICTFVYKNHEEPASKAKAGFLAHINL